VATVAEQTLNSEMKGTGIDCTMQLVMVGNNLDLWDAASLCAAANRKDQTTTKQRKNLDERSE